MLVQVKKYTREGHIELSNGWVIDKDYGFLAPGYVLTSFAAQGKSPERVLIAQSADSFPASSREQFYVSCSRGRESCTVYTSDREELLKAIARSDPKLTATVQRDLVVLLLQRRTPCVVPAWLTGCCDERYRHSPEDATVCCRQRYRRSWLLRLVICACDEYLHVAIKATIPLDHIVVLFQPDFAGVRFRVDAEVTAIVSSL